MKYDVDLVIQELIHLSEEQIDYTRKKLLDLPEDHLNWRPDPKRWNVLEVMEHLNRFGEFYLPKFSEAIRYPKKVKNSDTYRSSWIGEFAFERIRPVNGVVRYKTRSLQRNNPFLRILDKEVIEEHLDQQNRFREILQKSREIDLSGNRIPTMVGKWLRLSFGDSIRIFGYHTERHYVQLNNLLLKNHD